MNHLLTTRLLAAKERSKWALPGTEPEQGFNEQQELAALTNSRTVPGTPVRSTKPSNSSSPGSTAMTQARLNPGTSGLRRQVIEHNSLVSGQISPSQTPSSKGRGRQTHNTPSNDIRNSPLADGDNDGEMAKPLDLGTILKDWEVRLAGLLTVDKASTHEEATEDYWMVDSMGGNVAAGSTGGNVADGSTGGDVADDRESQTTPSTARISRSMTANAPASISDPQSVAKPRPEGEMNAGNEDTMDFEGQSAMTTTPRTLNTDTTSSRPVKSKKFDESGPSTCATHGDQNLSLDPINADLSFSFSILGKQ